MCIISFLRLLSSYNDINECSNLLMITDLKVKQWNGDLPCGLQHSQMTTYFRKWSNGRQLFYAFAVNVITSVPMSYYLPCSRLPLCYYNSCLRLFRSDLCRSGSISSKYSSGWWVRTHLEQWSTRSHVSPSASFISLRKSRCPSASARKTEMYSIRVHSSARGATADTVPAWNHVVLWCHSNDHLK